MSKKWFYPTAFSCWGSEERHAIARVLASEQFTQGEEVAAFEREFADYHGRAYGVMVNSGSSANLLAVSALKHLGEFKDGDRAIVPAIAWSTTYAPLVQHGLDLVVVDVDSTWNADVEAFRHDPGGIKVVVACSILGNPADLPRWANLAGIMGAALIEDNCESLGAQIGGRKTGTFGVMSTFSFFYSHQVSAIEGGMILTDDEEVANVLKMLRAHGWTRDLGGPKPPFSHEYEFQAFGYNVRGLELHAAIAREQLKKLEGFVEQRQQNAAFFAKATEDLPPIILPATFGNPSPFGLQFMLCEPEKRQRLADALRAEGIDCRLPTGGSFIRHPYGKHWRGKCDTPMADGVHTAGMFLGNGPLDLSEHIDRAVAVMRKVLK